MNIHPPHLPGQSTEDVEVCSETLQIESKIFFCDAKTNARGLYLKISEKKANRERSTIIVPGQSLPWFRELFNYYAVTAPAQATAKEYPVDSKVFFWSIGSNPWGRYLRISENGAGPKGRSHIMVPAGGGNAEGWIAFRDALARIQAYTNPPAAVPEQVNLEYLLQSAAGGLGGSQYAQQMPTTSVDHVTSYLDQLAIAGQQQQAQQQQHAGSSSEPQGAGLAVGHETVVGPGPAPPMLSVTEVGGLMVQAGHKRYFFDAGSNVHGQFVRITEVFGQDRVAIVVPSEALAQFQQAVGLCMQDLMGSGGSVASVTGPGLSAPISAPVTAALLLPPPQLPPPGAGDMQQQLHDITQQRLAQQQQQQRQLQQHPHHAAAAALQQQQQQRLTAGLEHYASGELAQQQAAEQLQQQQWQQSQRHE